ncbi:MAG: Crp/Fnr family transcriptional regulator [Methylomonas sp.]
MHQEVLSNLLKIPFLAEQPDEALISLAKKAKELKYHKRAIIITEGDTTNSIYIVLSGEVRVYSANLKSKEFTFAIQGPGSYFGDLSAVSDEPRSATVETLEATTCAVISQQDFMHWLELHPKVAIAMLKVMCEKIRLLTDRAKQLALSDAYERMVDVLMKLAVKEDNIFVIYNVPPQTGLANLIGTSRETINRYLTDLVKGGYLVKEGRKLKIIKKLPENY